MARWLGGNGDRQGRGGGGGGGRGAERRERAKTRGKQAVPTSSISLLMKTWGGGGRDTEGLPYSGKASTEPGISTDQSPSWLSGVLKEEEEKAWCSRLRGLRCRYVPPLRGVDLLSTFHWE